MSSGTALGVRGAELLGKMCFFRADRGGALVHTLAGDVASGCTVLAEAVKHGASAEEIRNAGELRTLGGCPPYDGIVRAPDKQED